MDFQATLFAPEPARGPACDAIERTPLSDGAWIDVARGWLPEADEVLQAMILEPGGV